MNLAPPPPPQWTLEILSGAERGRKYLISRSKVGIGRDTGNQIILTDLKVSRNHVQMELKEGRLYVQNLSPHNPIYLDEKEVTGSEYQAGQVLKLGQTTLVLQPYQPASLEKESGQKMAPPAKTAGRSGLSKPRIALLAVLALVVYLIFDGSSPKEEEAFKVSTISDIEQIVQESRERQRELKEQRSFASLPERRGFEAAERHYNQGFRDFQKGNYSRAIQSFRAALASDRNHDLAQRYHQLAERKLQEMVDQSLLEGRRHYEKGMYSLCAATMGKVLVLINDENDLKYQQAEELRQECFLNKTVM